MDQYGSDFITIVDDGGREYELTGKNGRRIDSEEMNRIFSLLIQHSRYAYQEEIRSRCRLMIS